MTKNLSVRKDNLLRTCKSYSAISKKIWFVLFAGILLVAGCKKVTEEAGIVAVCPIVVSTDPLDKAVDVALDKLVSVTFNTDMNPESIKGTTFVIRQGSQIISGTVASTADAKVFSFKPEVPLSPFVKYTGTITKEVTDKFNSAMVNDYVWTFTTIPQITLSAIPSTSGTVAFGSATGASNASGLYAQGSTVTVNATPKTGYTFTNWTDSGSATVASTSPSYQFAVAGNRTLQANFSLIPSAKYSVGLSSSPVAGGSTFGSGSYDVGSTVTVIATQNTGYTFKEWQENGTTYSTNPSFQFAIAGNRNFVAVYNTVAALQYALILSSNPPQGGSTSMSSASGSGPSFAAGTSVTINATANQGYTFTSWKEGTNIISTSPSYTFPINATRSLVANFTINTFTLTTSVSPLNSGTIVINPNQPSYNYGSSVLVTAMPAIGFSFKEWQDGSGTMVSTNAAYQVNMTANRVLVAVFTPSGTPGLIPPDLKSALRFGILSGVGVSNNAGPSVINNMDVGIYPGARSSITGFLLVDGGPGLIVNGAFYAKDDIAPPGVAAMLLQAKTDLTNAYLYAQNATLPAPALVAGDQGGKTLAPGIYKSTSTLLVQSGDLTLDAQGNANAVWIFQIAADFTTVGGAGGNIILKGGAKANNVFWQVGSSATLGDFTSFKGNIMALTSITMGSHSVAEGRMLAQNAAVVLTSTNTINKPN